MRAGDVAQSVLAPSGTAASSIHSLWQLMSWMAVTVFTLVMAFPIGALVRGLRRKRDSHLTFSPHVWHTPHTTPHGSLSPLEGQQLDGLLMWMPAGLIVRRVVRSARL